ncbi:MAG: 3-ketoacyl-ACP reductase [Lachnospiraceae bacterium]|nr:3-ketoacyl-ACP reductase [Lachnospiraceae bacterium]
MKIALVTGSRKGIGFEIASLLAKNDYRVIFSSRTPAAELGETLNAIRTMPNGCYYLPCDISKETDRKHLLDEIEGREGRFDLLVNNAGVAPLVRQDLLDTTVESFDRVCRINLYGTFFMCQQAAKRMVDMKKAIQEEYQPRIVNISSVSAYTSSVNRPEYCISKAGIAMITKLFADRLADEGIPVFEVRPGIIDTDMTKCVHGKYEEMIKNGITPIRRFGLPEDVAKAVLASCSGLLDFSTGQILNADGGFHLRRM